MPTTLTGGTGTKTLVGPDTANTWSISGTNGGTLNGAISFTDVGNLPVAGQRYVPARRSGSLPASSTAAAAQHARLLQPHQRHHVNLANGVATDLNSGHSQAFTNIQNFVGSNAPAGTPNYLYGPSTATTYTLSSATAGSLSSGPSYSGFGRLIGSGSRYADRPRPVQQLDPVRATPARSTPSGVGMAFSGFSTLQGGSNTDVLTGPNTTNTWDLTGPNAGTLTIGSSTLTFSGMEGLRGGTGNDTFALDPAAACRPGSRATAAATRSITPAAPAPSSSIWPTASPPA